jgi:hypothetical protein
VLERLSLPNFVACDFLVLRSGFTERDQKKGSTSRSCAGEDGSRLSDDGLGPSESGKWRTPSSRGLANRDETRVRRYDEVFRSAAIRKQTDHRAKARTKLGGVMTGLGSVTAICANSLSSISSSTDIGLVVTDPNSPLNSSSVLSARHFSGRLADHMACTFTTGIRGTAPPPLG